MNFFQKISLAIAASTAFALSAQETNLIKFGDFENLPPVRENTVKNMKKHGFDINRDPVVLIPGWFSKKGDKAINIVQATDADRNAVKSGKNAMNVKASILHMYTGTAFAPGIYDLSLAYKGKGKLMVIFYYYDKYGKHLGNSTHKVSLTAGNDWKTYNGKIELKAEKPGTSKARFAFVFYNSDITVDDIVLKSAK